MLWRIYHLLYIFAIASICHGKQGSPGIRCCCHALREGEPPNLEPVFRVAARFACDTLQLSDVALHGCHGDCCVTRQLLIKFAHGAPGTHVGFRNDSVCYRPRVDDIEQGAGKMSLCSNCSPVRSNCREARI